MSRKNSWRKVLAVPAILSLALGGALLAAGPASAAPAGLTITSPTNGSTVDSRTVTVNGSAFGGATITVNAGGSELGRTNVAGAFGVSSPFSITLSAFADDAAVAQTLNVGGIYGGSGIPVQSVDITLPAVVVPPAPLIVTSPADGEAVTSRTVIFTGTGIAGANVNVLYANDSRFAPQALVNDDGSWTATGTFADDAPTAQAIRVTQVDGGAGRGDITVNLTLPAVVVPAPLLTVTSPADGATVSSRTVTFTGTGIPDALVNVLYANNSRFAPQAHVNDDGSWTATGTFADDAPTAQAIRVTQVDGGAGRGDITVNLTLPAVVVPAPTLVVITPTEGQTVPSRALVTFAGTGTPGGTVSVLNPDGSRFAPVSVVGDDGSWVATGGFTDDAATQQAMRVTQVVGGAGRGDITVNIVLPVFELAAPVITSPEDGDTVTGKNVTFTGTGLAGANIVLLALPSDLNLSAAAAEPAPADPTDPVVVDEEGNWSVTVALAPNEYIASAVQTFGEVDSENVPVISDISNIVTFTLVAPVVTVPTTSVTPGGTLAATGVEANGFVGLAALLTLAGGVLLIARRKRELLGR